MEAHWDGSKPGALVLFAIPNEKTEENDFEISIPNVASLIITHELDGRFKGLKDFPASERPPVKPVFYAFRVMVGLGLLMIATGLIGAFLWFRGQLFETRWFLHALSYAWPAGFVAILAGWWVTETGRQPWIATGILRTADAASPVSANAVLTTLILFIVIYTVVFSMGIYYINRLIEKGPAGAAAAVPHGVPSRPLSAAKEAAREAIETTE
jgi:cytochrome d ubiquinol oxidase subunit I